MNLAHVAVVKNISNVVENKKYKKIIHYISNNLFYVIITIGVENMVYENEITVEVDCSIEELKNILATNNFKIEEEYDLIDYYLIKKAEGKHYYESLTACSTKILRMLYSMCKNNKTFLSD